MTVEDGRKRKRWGYQPSERFVDDVAHAFRTCNKQRKRIAELEKQLAEWKATCREQTRRTNVVGGKAIVYLQRIAELEEQLDVLP